MGVKSAPELYQQIMDGMLENIMGARAIVDDILVGGGECTEAEHNKRLEQVICKATEYNLRLNFAKCQIRQPRVHYYGHTLTPEGLEAHPD